MGDEVRQEALAGRPDVDEDRTGQVQPVAVVPSGLRPGGAAVNRPDAGGDAHDGGGDDRDASS